MHSDKSGRWRPLGLVAALGNTKISLPLKCIDVRFDARGEFVNVEMDQIFHQTNDSVLDVTYCFPLPPGAAVFRCEMHINGRVIRAYVEEEKEARRIVSEKEGQGHRTALVVMADEGMFSLYLGNVAPGDQVIIHLAYFQNLTRLGDWASFGIPLSPGMRYIPGPPRLGDFRTGGRVNVPGRQVPQVDMTSLTRISSEHPDAAMIRICGRVASAGGLMQDLSSPTHAVVVRDHPEASEVCLAESDACPDRDFVLRWTEAAVQQLSAVGWVDRTGDEVYSLVRLQAPPPSQTPPSRPLDVYFLVDISGSMAGLKWNRTAAAVLRFLELMPTGSRAWVTLFETNQHDLATQPLPPDELFLIPRVMFLEDWRPVGGTHLLPALLHLIGKLDEFSKGRDPVVILITDGDVWNEEEILQKLRERPDVVLHTVGLDSAVNEAFLKQLAAEHCGTSTLLTPHDDIVGAVTRLGGCLQPPVLTGLGVEGEWEYTDPYFPNLHCGRALYLPFKSTGEREDLVLTALDANGEELRIPVKMEEQGMQSLSRLWARRRMRLCMQQENYEGAVALGKLHNLICPGTSFMAWDETEVVKGAENSKAVFQPSIACPLEDYFVDGAMPKLEKRHCESLPDQWNLSVRGDDIAAAADTPVESEDNPSPAVPAIPRDSLRGLAAMEIMDLVGHPSSGLQSGDASDPKASFAKYLKERLPHETVDIVRDFLLPLLTDSFLDLFLDVPLSGEKGWGFLSTLFLWIWEVPAEVATRYYEFRTLEVLLTTACEDPAPRVNALEAWFQDSVKPSSAHFEELRHRLACLKTALVQT